MVVTRQPALWSRMTAKRRSAGSVMLVIGWEAATGDGRQRPLGQQPLDGVVAEPAPEADEADVR